MFNSGFRGKRASDNTGTIASPTQYIQQKYPQPSISGYSIVGTDDTALNPAGGQTVLVNGTGFATGAAVTVNGVTISPVTVVSPTQLSFTSTALAGGSYSLIVYNSTGGAAILVPGLIYSAVPTWTTAAGSIGSFYETTSINTSVVATSDSAITYSLVSGSLPSGATFYSNGVITGTSPVENGSSTYTFAVKAEDAELQDTTRTFTLTINTDVVTWSSPANNTTYTSNVNSAIGNVTLSATSAAGYNVSYAANTLPTGISLAGNTISGTPTVAANTTTLLTATAATTNRTATRTINWVIELGTDQYFYATSLLLNGETSSNYWIQDISTNNYSLTVVGDTKPAAFSPFNTGYSAYFDGSSDYLTIPANAAFNFGTADYTVEGWLYSFSTTWTLYATGGSGSLDQFVCDAGTLYWAYPYINAGAGTTGFYTSADLYKWTHVAVSCVSGTTRIFKNGAIMASTSTSFSIGSSGNALQIGRRSDGFYNTTGYMSNIRALKGTGLYSAAFTPPTSPFSVVANTSVLVCNSSWFKDSSANNFTITITGDVKISSFNPFVETNITTGSGYFDSVGDYLTSPASFNTSGTWTIEAWMYLLLAGQNDVLICASSDRLYIQWVGSTFYLGDASINNISFSSKPLNRWFHIAVVKNGANYAVYFDGVSMGTSSSALFTDTVTTWQIGARVSQGISTYGYISNLRIVHGTAVYTSAFTPPTTPLTAITNTTLLTLQNRLGENNSRFVDTSTAYNVINRFANTTQGTFSPYSQTGWSGYFTGSSTSYITTPATTILNQGQTYTVQCWIYPTAFTTSTSAVRRMYLFVKGVIYAGLSIHSDGTLGWYGWPTPGGIIVASAAGTITTNVWQHVALVVNPSNYIKLFKNGVEVGTAGYTAAGSDGSAIIIGHGDTGQGTDGFIGYISNFKITLSSLTGGQLDYSATPTISSNAGTSLLVLQTNRFNDTSANNLAITAAAAASIQSFSPFAPAINTPTSYSGYFDGTGDYILIPANAAFNFGTGDFTLECWIYSLANQATYAGVLCNLNTTNGFYFSFSNGSNNMGFSDYSTYYIASSSIPIANNVWTHIALTRSGTTVRMFFNGQIVGTATNNTAVFGSSTSGTAVGFNGVSHYFNGYISNVRLVKGTAVYTSTFTPPTSPLTAIANTSLLTCQSNTFIDNSTNNFTITGYGNAIALSFNPFGTTSLTAGDATYSITNIGGSMYFDGSGDYLSLPHNSFLVYGTNNFTIEFWIYVIAYGAPSRIFQKGTGSTGYSMDMSAAGVFTYNNNSTIGGSTCTIAVPLKAWTHVVLVRTGTGASETKWYINGVSAGSWTYSVNNTETEPLIIGGSGASFSVNGFISNFRLINGAANYLSQFSPPVSPLTAISNTSLLLNGISSGIIDYTGKNDLETVGDAKLSTTVKKFGSASMYFDGTGDYLKIPNSPVFEFGSGSFTIEFWIYPTSNPSEVLPISRTYDGSSYSFASYLTTGTVRFLYNGLTQINSSHTLTLNIWTHIAYVRNSNTLTIYANGTNVGSGSITGSLTASTRVTSVGAREDGNFPFAGYLDDVRITYGIARYTSNFTPPTTAFLTY